ncbi:hypothetical protein KEM55_004640 [Ascosphaera atra]|nr:hypothetical protein KEM55_004640 [Ascosphaera atra]
MAPKNAHDLNPRCTFSGHEGRKMRAIDTAAIKLPVADYQHKAKAKSGLLRDFWRRDPFKAKWAILARAYSRIRDDHIEDVSLDSFLSLNGPLIGIVSPADYPAVMGLKVAKDSGKRYSVRHTEVVGPTQCEVATTLSVDDIVQHCYQTGYVVGCSSRLSEGFSGSEVAMAVTAQHPPPLLSPYNPPGCSQPDDSRGTSNMAQDTMQQQNLKKSCIHSQCRTVDLANSSNAMKTHSNAYPSRHTSPVKPYTAQEFGDDLKAAADRFGNNDRYQGLFNPAADTPMVEYDPYAIQCDFDAFEIGGFIPI